MSGGAGRIRSVARGCHKGESDHGPTAHSDRTLQAIATLHGGAEIARSGTLMTTRGRRGGEPRSIQRLSIGTLMTTEASPAEAPRSAADMRSS